MSDVVVVLAAAALTATLRVVPVLLSRSRPTRDAGDAPAAEDGDLGTIRAQVSLLPLAVLTALVVPGAALVDTANPAVGLAAAGTAVLLVVIVRTPPAFLVIVCAVAAALVAHGLTD